jgi:hypothetical protein
MMLMMMLMLMLMLMMLIVRIMAKIFITRSLNVHPNADSVAVSRPRHLLRASGCHVQLFLRSRFPLPWSLQPC